MKRFLTGTFGVLPVLLLLTARGQADIQDLTIAVDGVVCPVCAHSINMGLRQLSGVKTVKVLMENRVKVDIRMQPGAWVEPSRFFQQISQVGYRARQAEVKMHLRGLVTTSDDGFVLTMSDIASAPVSFQLAPAETTGKRGDEIHRAMENLGVAIKASKTGRCAVDAEAWWRAAPTKSQHATLLLTKINLLPEL